MGDEFKIFVHRLSDGQKEKIEETLAPAFLEIEESGLAFDAPVRVQGEAEYVEQTLVLRLVVDTEATLPCAICNQEVAVALHIPHFVHTVGIEEIKGDVFNFAGVLREAILLELPPRAECNKGNCPEREALAKYFSRSE